MKMPEFTANGATRAAATKKRLDRIDRMNRIKSCRPPFPNPVHPVHPVHPVKNVVKEQNCDRSSFHLRALRELRIDNAVLETFRNAALMSNDL